ncbi:hypothetical protein [Shewanella sp.]|uniref:hypothetical protein n=1 Tax=Shewanella sp. TaxID=50422 RepID=UPI003569763E
MKKLVLAVAVLAAGAGGYWYSQQQGEGAYSNAALDYIPTDTPLFSAQLKPFPLKDYLTATAANSVLLSPPAEIDQVMADMDEPAARFGLYLYKAYLEGLKAPDVLLKRFGLADEMRAYTYTLGALPVIRWEAGNPAAFWSLIDEAEKDSGLQHTKMSVAGQEYRAYRVTDASDEDFVDFVLAQRDGLITATFSSSLLEPQLLEQALGITKVANPISESTILSDIIKTHGFMDDSISYINHQELVRALVSGDNQLGNQLAAIFAKVGDDPLAEIRTPLCQSELNGIAANWPRTVAGLTSMKVDSKQASMDMKFVVESKNTVVLNALEKMRGFLPAFVQKPGDAALTMGLGLDVGELAPSLTKIWNDMLSPRFQCEPLAQWQAELEQANPAMLGMATGMADGVKGIGLSVLDFELDLVDEEPQLKKLDSLLSLSADDPAFLLEMVKPFAPMLAGMDLKSGEDVDLSGFMPPELGVSAKLGLRGQHLVLFTGERSQKLADSLKGESLSANGIYSMSVDYSRFMGPLMAMLEATGEPIPPELQGLENYKMNMNMTMDVVPEGVVIHSGVVTRP